MKPTLFENLFTKEKLICENPRDVQEIDGVEYLLVHREFNQRNFLIRRDSLKKLEKIKS